MTPSRPTPRTGRWRPRDRFGHSQPAQQPLLLRFRPERRCRASEVAQHAAQSVVGPVQAVLGRQPLPYFLLAVIDRSAGHPLGQQRRGPAGSDPQTHLQRVQPGFAVLDAQIQP